MQMWQINQRLRRKKVDQKRQTKQTIKDQIDQYDPSLGISLEEYINLFRLKPGAKRVADFRIRKKLKQPIPKITLEELFFEDQYYRIKENNRRRDVLFKKKDGFVRTYVKRENKMFTKRFICRS